MLEFVPKNLGKGGCVPKEAGELAPIWRKRLIQKKVKKVKEMIKEEKLQIIDVNKDEKIKKFLVFLENYFKKEFRRIDTFPSSGNIQEVTEEIDRDRIFIFKKIPKKIWEKIVGEEKAGLRTLGAFSDLGYLAINQEEIKQGGADENNFKLFCSLAHEIIHSKSFQKYIITDTEIVERGNRMLSIEQMGRTGYQTMKRNEENIKKRFSFFNEAITERITRDFLYENKKILNECFGFNEEEIEDYIYGKNSNNCYNNELKFLHRMIKIIAQKKGIDYRKVLDDFKRGYFSGQTSVLKILNEIWGPGTIKTLSLIEEEKEKLGLIKSIKLLSNQLFVFFTNQQRPKKFKISQEILELFEGLEEEKTR